MKTRSLLIALPLLLFSFSTFAQTGPVTATVIGTGPTIDITGTATGTFDGDTLMLAGIVRMEFDDGSVSVWETRMRTTIDFIVFEGDWESLECTDISGVPACAGLPTSGQWDSVSGSPWAFTTTVDTVSFDWTVERVNGIPVMPLPGLLLTACGLLLVALRRLSRG